MRCPFCQKDVKLNQIVRSACHVLGCVNCYGRKQPIPFSRRHVPTGARRFTLYPDSREAA